MPTFNIDHCLPSRQDYIDAECEEKFIQPRKAGGFSFEDGESTYKWAIFSRPAVEAIYGEITADNAEDIASNLTGWGRSYGGPGRWFSSDPTIKVYKRNLIVKQHCGLDI